MQGELPTIDGPWAPYSQLLPDGPSLEMPGEEPMLAFDPSEYLNEEPWRLRDFEGPDVDIVHSTGLSENSTLHLSTETTAQGEGANMLSYGSADEQTLIAATEYAVPKGRKKQRVTNRVQTNGRQPHKKKMTRTKHGKIGLAESAPTF
jgi:hypothetical protein